MSAALKMENTFQIVTKNNSMTVNQTFSKPSAWSIYPYLYKCHIFLFFLGPYQSSCQCLWLCVMVTAVPLSVRCQMASSHAISSRLVFNTDQPFKIRNKTTVLNCNDTLWHTEQWPRVVITVPLILLPEECRCFTNPCPDTNTVSHLQQHAATGSRLCLDLES